MKSYIFILFFFSNYLFAQNLVPNPSFEKGTCPKNYCELTYVEGWGEDSINIIGNYYNKCAKVNTWFNLGIPDNDSGHQYARTGNAYAGLIWPYAALQCHLLEPLEKGATYYLEFYVSLADKSLYSIWRLGAYFSKTPIKRDLHNHNIVSKLTPDILNDSLNYLSDTINWVKVSGYYKAKGNEEYLLISSFSISDRQKKVFNIKNTKPISKYGDKRAYYIDDVLLKRINSSEYLQQLKDSITYVRRFKLINNKYILSKEAQTEMDLIIKTLKTFKNVKAEINLHISPSGDPTFDKKVTEDNAKYLSDYFLKNGILVKQIKCKGLGSNFPINSNLTDAEKLKNLRIEVKITDI